MIETQKKINQTEKEKKMSKPKKNAEKNKTEIKVRYSNTFTGNNTKKQNSKRKMKRKMQTGKHKIIQHLRQKVADTALDKRKTCKQTKTQIAKRQNDKRILKS